MEADPLLDPVTIWADDVVDVDVVDFDFDFDDDWVVVDAATAVDDAAAFGVLEVRVWTSQFDDE